jgi:hypothetical protein
MAIPPSIQPTTLVSAPVQLLVASAGLSPLQVGLTVPAMLQKPPGML